MVKHCQTQSAGSELKKWLKIEVQTTEWDKGQWVVGQVMIGFDYLNQIKANKTLLENRKEVLASVWLHWLIA